jgi:hypothetical protein
LHNFAKPNEFTSRGEPDTKIYVGGAIPSNQPSDTAVRHIPTKDSISYLWNRNYINIYGERDPNSESWFGGPQKLIFNPSYTQVIASVATSPYFNVYDASRYYEPTKSDLVGRVVDLCYDASNPMYNTTNCQNARQTGVKAWDSSASPFRGVKRNIEPNIIEISNSTGITKWFTDPYGQTLVSSPDPSRGIILEQFVSSSNVDGKFLNFSGRDFSNNGANGVHAPN